MLRNARMGALARAATVATACTLLIAGCATDAGELAARTTSAATAAVFQVGFAAVAVSTGRSVTMGGYGTYFGLTDSSRKSSLGVHDPLLATAVAIEGSGGETLALASVDSVGLSSESVRRLRQKVAASLGETSGVVRVHVAATHSHQTPDTVGIWGTIPVKNGRDRAYMEQIEGAIADAVVTAVRAKSPAELSYATTSKPNNTSAAAPERRDDGVVTVVARRAGTIVGTLTQWSAHPTMIGAKSNTLSADYVGAFRHAMASGHPGAVHVYVNGALGDVYALDDGARAPDPFASGSRDRDVLIDYEKAAAVGFDLATRVEAALPDAVPLEDASVVSTSGAVASPVDNATFLLASGLGILEKKIPFGVATSEVSWFRIGELAGVTVPGELFPSEANRIRALLRANGARATMIVGMGDDWLGYLMSAAEYEHPALAYHRSLCPHRDAGDRVVARTEQLIP